MSVLDKEGQRLLKQLLLETLKNERLIEKQRQQLGSTPGFDPYQIFRVIDLGKNASINSVELLRFLR